MHVLYMRVVDHLLAEDGNVTGLPSLENWGAIPRRLKCRDGLGGQ